MLKIGENNKNFYPTPSILIEKMLRDVDWTKVKTVLEPSAGKGNIVDIIMTKKPKYSYYNIDFDVDCIELDEQLQMVLRGKGYRVVHNNFLTFNTMKSYDLIVMNPPFDNGAKHLLKALNMQKNGGSIICLLNAETIKNCCTKERTLLKNKLEEFDAKIEFLKDEFLSAERKTSVEVALIMVCVPKKETILDHDFEKYRKGFQFQDVDMEESYQENMISKYFEENDFVKDLVDRFETETRIGFHLIDEYSRLKPFLTSEVKTNYECNKDLSYCNYTLALYMNGDEDKKYLSTYSLNKNRFLKLMRKKYWSFLFGHEKFVAKLTSNLKDELQKRLNNYEEYDFSVFNIYTLMQEVQSKTIKGIEDTLLNLFDELSGKYAYHEELNNKNIHYFNGWKTNKAWYINNRVIMPYLMSSFRGIEKLCDIHKTLAYIAGYMGDFDVYGEMKKLGTESDEYYSNSCFEKYVSFASFPYFDIKFFKKGTAHIIFKDKDLLDKFNLWACKKRNWIPHFYGRKKYKDMSEEEKQLVKEFSGSEDEYNKIYNNQQKYLVDTNILLLDGVNNG